MITAFDQAVGSPHKGRLSRSSARYGQPVELTGADAGTRRSLRVGESVTVVLAENPTTGYQWQPEVDASALVQTDDHYDGPTVPRGAGGTRRVTFVAKRAGTTGLRLVKKRPWETSPIETYEVTLDVAD